MAPKSQTVADLAQTDEDLMIVELALSGMQPAAIARKVGRPRQYVMEKLDELLTHVTDVLIEKVERLSLMNLARLEMMLSVAMPQAVGGEIDLNNPVNEQRMLNGEDPVVKTSPDRLWMGTSIKIIETEMAWEDKLYMRRAKYPDAMNDDDRLVQSMGAQDELYGIAQENMQTDWLGMADMTTEDLLPEGAPRVIPSNPSIDRIEKDIAKLQKALDDDGISADDPAED